MSYLGGANTDTEVGGPGIIKYPRTQTHKYEGKEDSNKLPHVKGAISHLDRKDKDTLVNAGKGAISGLGGGP